MRAPIKTSDEFDKVFEEAAESSRPAMYRLMLLLSVRLGLRPVELAKLETSWFSGDELRIVSGKSKRGHARSLPVDDEIMDALRAHMGNETGVVFRNKRGDEFTPNGISEAIRRLYKLSGTQGSTYSGRRTAATNMVDKGVNIRVVQEFLGHTNLATTAAYCSVTPSMLRKAVFG